MVELMISAPASGSGKTVLTCALLAALKGRGLAPCAFKCGPDYIDPLFHTAVGVDSHNLDLFLSDEDTVRGLYRRYGGGHGSVVVEGAMGFYDGLGGSTDRASAWHGAHTLDLPVLLAVRPKGTSLTLAAQIQGLTAFRTPSRIAGLFLSDCSPMLAKSLTPMLEEETGLPVAGYLPHMEEAVLESRHLGLQTAGEIKNLTARIQRVARTLDDTLDWEKFFTLFDRRAGWETPPPSPARRGKAVHVAVARDEAFCFTYAETLDALEDAGAELVFFSPLHDENIPEAACALYLPGGYPELYAAQLAEHGALRVRWVLIPGPGPGGNGRQTLPHGGVSARRGPAEGAAGAVRLHGAGCGHGQPAVPGGGVRPRPRVPLLGFHTKRGGAHRGQAPDRAELEMRLRQ